MVERIVRWMNPWSESVIAAAETVLDNVDAEKEYRPGNIVVNVHHHELAVVDRTRSDVVDVRVKAFLSSGECVWVQQLWLRSATRLVPQNL